MRAFGKRGNGKSSFCVGGEMGMGMGMVKT